MARNAGSDLEAEGTPLRVVAGEGESRAELLRDTKASYDMLRQAVERAAQPCAASYAPS